MILLLNLDSVLSCVIFFRSGTNGVGTINNSFNSTSVMPPDELFDILSDESLHESLCITDDSVIIPAEHESINVVDNQARIKLQNLIIILMISELSIASK